MDRPKILIRAPKFELDQLVTLYWNGQERSTKIVQRWKEMDYALEGYWSYKIAGDDQQLYPEAALEPRD